MNEDLSAQLSELEAEIAEEKRLRMALQARLNDQNYQISGLKTRVHQTQLALNLNTRADKQTAIALETVREALRKIEQSDQQRFVAIRDLSIQQDKKAEELKEEQKQQAKRFGSDRLWQGLVIVFLAAAYAFGQLQAGEVVDAIVALAPVGLWGIATAAKS